MERLAPFGRQTGLESAVKMLYNWLGMEQPRISGKRILVVEDDSSARDSITLLLRIDRHIVTEAKNGEEALDLVSGQPFDLVVMDYAMPGMLGDELAGTIKKLSPGQAVLMITGSAEKHGIPQNCIDGFLNKPFTLAELRQAVAPLVSQVPA